MRGIKENHQKKEIVKNTNLHFPLTLKHCACMRNHQIAYNSSLLHIKLNDNSKSLTFIMISALFLPFYSATILTKTP